jgi:ankyrin repeat protein
LLASGAKVDRRSNQGDTPLLRAAASGTPETLAHLLQRRSDPNVQNAFGDTPLIVAARRGHKAICSQLLAAGANKGLRNKIRATAEEVASARGFQDIARLLGG